MNKFTDDVLFVGGAKIGGLPAAAAQGEPVVLDSTGKIPASVIPPISIVEVFQNVTSEAAMLALLAGPGDLAIRTDTNQRFVLMASPASTLANWIVLSSEGGAVTSVAGLTGVVAAAALRTALEYSGPTYL